MDVRRCDSPDCDRDAQAVWEATVDVRFSLVSHTRCFFALCGEHDQKYTEQMPNHLSMRRSDLKVGLLGA